jgi:cellulose synthase (UDP-forming)
MNDIKTWAALLSSAGLLILMLESYGIQSPKVRASAALICAYLSLRYIYWRVLFTFPSHQKIAQSAWCLTFLSIELCTIVSTLLIYLFMSRSISRSAEADAHQDSPLRNAPTDIFIATYNESYEILERTVIGALAVEHSDHRVWVLDDGDRPWVREMSESLGAYYVARKNGDHAKAGNVNNGLKKALETGRQPEFVLLLDADFIPYRTILQRVLGLFDDPAVGIVQTPQHFFNTDPVQANLFCTAVWPDEQRFFFNVLMPCKDAWGAAFCCGTSAILRVDALLAAGGMATETVTEDMLTSFKCNEFGYRTIYLNERLSLGLAPESIVDFMSQRSRWCLGAIQQLFTPWSFAGRASMSLINRIAFFDTVLFWMSGAAFKVMLISAPALYWFTGTATIHATLPDLIRWMAPMIVANLIFMRYYAGNRILPIITDVTQLLTAFVITRTVVSGLIRPFGRPFKVTAKGRSSSRVVIQWKLMAPYAILAAVTILGVATHVQTFSNAHGVQGYSLNIFWSIVNAATLTLAAMACIEVPHRRRTDRFSTAERGVVRIVVADDESVRDPFPGETLSSGDEVQGDIPCRLQNISLGGAEIVCSNGWGALMNSAQLSVYNDADQVWSTFSFTVINRRANVLTLQFNPDDSSRHALIRKLFTGMYHQDIEEVSALAVLCTLARNLVS